MRMTVGFLNRVARMMLITSARFLASWAIFRRSFWLALRRCRSWYASVALIWLIIQEVENFSAGTL